MAAKELNTTILKNSSNLKAYYRLENGSLTTDSSSSGYTLTNYNTVADATGMFGGAGDFESGSSQYLSVADASCPDLEISGSQTWMCWVKPESVSANMHPMGKSPSNASNYRRLFVTSAGAAGFTITGLTTNTAVTTANGIITAGNWYHLCGVYDATAQKLSIYVNGAATTVTASGSAPDTNGDFSIGRLGTWTGGEYFDGLIDDAAIFSSALSPDSIKELYEGRTVGELWPQTGLVGLWHLSNEADFSGSGYHLTNNNTVTFPAGKFNGAGLFASASSKSLTIASASAPNTNFTGARTISCWVNHTSVTGTQMYVSKVDNSNVGYALYLTSSKPSFFVSGTGATNMLFSFSTTISTNTWYHIVGVFDTSTAMISVNGKIETYSFSNTPNNTAQPFAIGCSYQGAGNTATSFMNGYIDEAAVFSRALTATEIRKLYAWSMGKYQ